MEYLAEDCVDNAKTVLYHQINSFFPLSSDQKKIIDAQIDTAFREMEENYSVVSSKRYNDNGRIIISPYFSITWMVFLYRISHLLSKNGHNNEADIIYYLNKIMHSVDWFYQINLPKHFLAEHPLASVLGKAEYGDYIFIYQGTTVGGNRKHGNLYYPKIGENVLMYANSTILGDCQIGNNVIISANAYLN